MGMKSKWDESQNAANGDENSCVVASIVLSKFIGCKSPLATGEFENFVRTSLPPPPRSASVADQHSPSIVARRRLNLCLLLLPLKSRLGEIEYFVLKKGSRLGDHILAWARIARLHGLLRELSLEREWQQVSHLVLIKLSEMFELWPLRKQYEEIENVVEKVIDILGRNQIWSFGDDLVDMHSRVKQLEEVLDLSANDTVRLEAENVEAIVIEQYPEEFLQGRIRVDALSKMDHLKLLILKNVNCFGTLNYISNELRYLFWNHFPWIIRVDALSKMDHLKLLILKNVNCFGTLNYISNELRYLFWNHFPWMFLPSTFHLDQLVELIMPHSNMKKLWEGKKCLPNLRRMDLSHSKNLIGVPDLSEVQRLTFLDLEGCIKIVGIHPSIGILRELHYLNLKNCKNLVLNLNILFALSSLRTLILSGCLKLLNSKMLMDPSDTKHLEEVVKITNVIQFPTSSVYRLLMLPFHIFYPPKPEDSLAHVAIVIPGSEIPKWFNKQKASTSISMDPSAVIDDPNWIGVAICVLFVTHQDPTNLVERYDNSSHTFSYGVNNVNLWPKSYSVAPMHFKKDLVTAGFDHLLTVFYSRQEFIHLLSSHPNTMHDLHGIEFETWIQSPKGLCVVVKNCGYRWVFKEDLQQFNSNMFFSGNSSSRKRKLLTRD
ncbi:hypothetical protein DEO72_LG3g1972 [Vigna unguiculata]|uniref:C-JID domain-containing protein n=1 Tax=Vigna unguiculata TaxID=3917 RepID=A0A4D6LG99_VIGUN|nr:hypothetical protein DEO72_LG3g1972 [Vigna unguiculata]